MSNQSKNGEPRMIHIYTSIKTANGRILESRSRATKKPSGNDIASVSTKISSVIFEPDNMESTVSVSLSIHYLPLSL